MSEETKANEIERIEQAVGGSYQISDGRQFWIDGPVAREIARRVCAAQVKQPQPKEVSVSPGDSQPLADDRSDYEDLGFLSSAPPERSIGLWCDKCRVRWTGCQDAAECPRCGSVEAYQVVTQPQAGVKQEINIAERTDKASGPYLNKI